MQAAAQLHTVGCTETSRPKVYSECDDDDVKPRYNRDANPTIACLWLISYRCRSYHPVAKRDFQLLDICLEQLQPSTPIQCDLKISLSDPHPISGSHNVRSVDRMLTKQSLL